MKRKFFVSLPLAVPVIILSPMMGMRLPFQASFTGSSYAMPAMATTLFFCGGMSFLQGANAELARRKPAKTTLIALGSRVSYIYSLYAFVMNTLLRRGQHVAVFMSLSTIIVALNAMTLKVE